MNLLLTTSDVNNLLIKNNLNYICKVSNFENEHNTSEYERLVQKIKKLIALHSETIQEVKLLREKATEADRKIASLLSEKEVMLNQINLLNEKIKDEKSLQKENREIKKSIVETIEKIDNCIEMLKDSKVNE